MNWTSNWPTKEGYYWVLTSDDNYKEPEIIEFVFDEYLHKYKDVWDHLDASYNCMFYGPINKPEKFKNDIKGTCQKHEIHQCAFLTIPKDFSKFDADIVSNKIKELLKINYINIIKQNDNYISIINYSTGHQADFVYTDIANKILVVDPYSSTPFRIVTEVEFNSNYNNIKFIN